MGEVINTNYLSSFQKRLEVSVQIGISHVADIHVPAFHKADYRAELEYYDDRNIILSPPLVG